MIDSNEREQALADHLEVPLDEVGGTYGTTVATLCGNHGEWLVLTDAEADELWEEHLDNYLEECIYPELPEVLCRYFDDEAWKRDARYDGRGLALAVYDHEEHESGDYYLYRIN